MRKLTLMAVGLAGLCMLSMLAGCLSPTDYGSDAMISTLRVRVSALESTSATHAGYFAAGANRSITNAPAATNVVAFSHGVATNLTTEP